MTPSDPTRAADRRTSRRHAPVDRRTLLAAAGGLGLLSACGRPAPAARGQDAPPARPAAPSPPQPTSPPVPLTVRREPEYLVSAARQKPGHKTVALTMDDGPDPEWTPRVLEVLRGHRVTATFFMLGASAAAHPDLVRAVAAEGHQAATHTWSHKNLRELSGAGVRREIERALDAVTEGAGGVRPSLFRAPYGNWSPAVFRACAELAQRPIGWTVDPRDWDGPGASLIASRVLEQIGPRSIVLNHDGGGDRSRTVAALQTYLPQLLSDGYRFVAL